ncbi:hypothetical protein [Photobacterium damselae]|uniref:hypothetical protein n=1 Tax=Photobacterium damselae TaxID=38293 RepID=UPI001F256CA1|nr:hypothetical protein [Photobacterium damselae]UKA04671.1 hypothetical protein IHC89_23925 [Photobacterium damselae subsp. damselae]
MNTQSKINVEKIHPSMSCYDFSVVPLALNGISDPFRSHILATSIDQKTSFLLGCKKNPFIYDTFIEAQADIKLLNDWKKRQ